LIFAGENFLEWKALGCSFLSSLICNNIAPSAKSDIYISTMHSHYELRSMRIGVVVKQCFSFLNDFDMSSVHFQSFGDPLVELLRGLVIFEKPSINLLFIFHESNKSLHIS
jgi:hypothetical protein